MRKTVFFIFALLLSATAHCQKFNPTEGSHVVYQVPQYVEPNWYEGANELCPKDQWMRITDEMKNVPLVNNLADAYNVMVVFHSVYSDYESYERHGESTAKEILELNTSLISNAFSRQCADEFKNSMARSQSDTNVNVADVINKYFERTTPTYNLERLMGNDEIFSETIYEAAHNHDALGSDPFSLRCIKAIELAHDTSNGMPNYDAQSKLVEVLTAGQYSPLLLEVWKTWRAMVAIQMGHSKDSYIPNAEYNRLRMIGGYTMLCHIKDYPNDWVAVNNFLLLASEQNVAIYGPYPFGNQSLVVFYEMFPELMPTSLETEKVDYIQQP